MAFISLVYGKETVLPKQSVRLKWTVDKGDTVFTTGKASDSYHPRRKKEHSSYFKKEDKELTYFKPDDIFPYWLYQSVIIRYLPARYAKVLSRSVVSDSLRPYGLQPVKLLYPWNSLGKNTGVNSHFLLQGIFLTQRLNPGLPYCRQILYHLSHRKSHIFSDSFPLSDQIRSVTQSCPTLCDSMNHSTPGLPVHHQLPEITETHVHWVSDAIQPSHPLSSPSLLAPNPSQHQSLFQSVNSSHEVVKVLEFQL